MKLIHLFLILAILFSTKQIQAQSNNNSSEKKAENYFQGKIVSKKGNTIIINIDSGSILPSINKAGILSLYFEETVFGMKTTGWLDIGETTVVSLQTTEITLKLTKELSVITNNGQKVDHFQKGKVVRFNWNM